jgi:carbon starvation protein CstA
VKNKIMQLLTVKSIVTIALTIVFCVLSIRGDIDAEKFLTIFTVVISFYFGTKYEQNNNKFNKG